jgi:hypothetical protein
MTSTNHHGCRDKHAAAVTMCGVGIDLLADSAPGGLASAVTDGRAQRL